MNKLRVEISAELALAAGLDEGNLSEETARLLALELYREDKISLGRAAELCQTAVEAFMEYAAQHNVPLHYGADELEEDRRTLQRLNL
jgi:predicted HTH domain antitoxin